MVATMATRGQAQQDELLVEALMYLDRAFGDIREAGARILTVNRAGQAGQNKGPRAN